MTHDAQILFPKGDVKRRVDYWDKVMHGGKSFFSAFDLEEHTVAVLEGVNCLRIGPE